jgi:hypothetical protein
MKAIASSERKTLNLVEGMESRLLQDSSLPIPEGTLLRDFHESLEDVIIAFPLHSERPKAIPGGLANGESGQVLHYD